MKACFAASVGAFVIYIPYGKGFVAILTLSVLPVMGRIDTLVLLAGVKVGRAMF